MNIKTGMNVRVIRGNHRGQEGKILYVFPKKERVIIEGVNLIKRHTRPSQENPQGGIVEKEMSINMSNLMLMYKNKPVKVGFKFVKDNKKVRFNKINGDQID